VVLKVVITFIIQAISAAASSQESNSRYVSSFLIKELHELPMILEFQLQMKRIISLNCLQIKLKIDSFY